MDKLIFYLLLIPMIIVCGYVALQFLWAAIGGTIDILTGSNDMWMWTFS